MQQNVEGFANYYQTLTPAQRLVYGRLKFFDIYHCWYFNALLALLSANIILASIDRFPKTWAIAAKPNLTVPLRWLKEQRGSATVTLSGNRDQVLDRLESELHVYRQLVFQLVVRPGYFTKFRMVWPVMMQHIL